MLGKTQSFGSDVVTEVEVIVPEYQPAGTECDFSKRLPCDFRQQNFEVWTIQKGDKHLATPLPRRRYHIAGIVLDKEAVKTYKTVSGLPITSSITSSREIGRTGADLRFIEINRHMTNAPTKLRSNGVEGYVSMPRISKQQSEFADMTGGLFQVFRSDWQAAESSFTRVIDNTATRLPLKIDAYLLRGMTKFRQQKDGFKDIQKAAELAPYDAGAARYLITAKIAANHATRDIARTLKNVSYLFEPNDPWFQQVSRFVAL